MGLVLKALADALGAVLQGDDDTVIERVAPLETAGSGDLSFLANRRYAKHLDTTAASAVILAPEDQSLCPVACLVLDNPYLGYARAATLLYPPRSVSAGVHQTAWVSPNAVVPRSAAIGPHAVIEAYARLDEDVVVGAGCVIGEVRRLVARARFLPTLPYAGTSGLVRERAFTPVWSLAQTASVSRTMRACGSKYPKWAAS